MVVDLDLVAGVVVDARDRLEAALLQVGPQVAPLLPGELQSAASVGTFQSYLGDKLEANGTPLEKKWLVKWLKWKGNILEMRKMLE